MKGGQGVLSPQVSPGGRSALAVCVLVCLLLTLLSVVVGIPLITARSWSQGLVGCFQTGKSPSWSQPSHFQGGRMGDTGLRDGEMQGDEVRACCSLRGFLKIQLLQTATLSLRKP